MLATLSPSKNRYALSILNFVGSKKMDIRKLWYIYNDLTQEMNYLYTTFLVPTL